MRSAIHDTEGSGLEFESPDPIRGDRRISRRAAIASGAVMLSGLAAAIAAGEHSTNVDDLQRIQVLKAEIAGLTQNEAMRRANHTLDYMAAYRILDGPNHVLSAGRAFPELERMEAIVRIAKEIHADNGLRTDPEAAFMYALNAITKVGATQQPELYQGRGPSSVIDSLTAIGLSIDPETVIVPRSNPLPYEVLHGARLYWDSVASDVSTAPTLAPVDRWNLWAAGVQLDRRMARVIPANLAPQYAPTPIDSQDMAAASDETLAQQVAQKGVSYLPLLLYQIIPHT